MSKTLEEIKENIVNLYGYKSWDTCVLSGGITDIMIDYIALSLSQSQTQELQEQNAELVEMLSKLVLLLE